MEVSFHFFFFRMKSFLLVFIIEKSGIISIFQILLFNFVIEREKERKRERETERKKAIDRNGNSFSQIF